MDNRYYSSNILHNNSADAEPAFLVLKGVALGCLCAWTVVANVLVFVVLYKNPRLQTVPNLLVGNLAFSDLCLGCVVLPLSAVYAVTLHWPFGKLACEIWISTDVLSCTASIWNLSMIGLDRYWAITSPITYITKRNMRSAVLMILSIWGLSSLISLAPFLGWRQYSEKGNYFIDIETRTSHCQFLELPAYTLYSATGSFYIPLLVMFFVYFQIYRAFADHRARQIYRQKVIKKHIESTILHEISRVLPTSDEFAKEGDDDEEEEEEEEEEESENDNINEDDEEDEESDRPNKKKNSQLEEESGNGPPTTSGGSTSGSTSGIPETTNVAVATVKLRQLTPAPSILKTTNQLRYNAVRCNCDENHAINTNSNNSNDKLARTNELTMNEKSPLKKTSSVVGPDAVNQRRKTTCISRKKSAPAKAAHQDGVAGTAAAPSRAKAGKALQFSSHPPSARFPSTKPHSQKHHDRRRQVAHPTKGVYRDRSLTYERVQRHKMRKEKRAMLRASLQKKPPAISAAKERRGVKVLGIILGCFTVCWLPFFIMYIVTGFCRHCRPNAHIEQFITWLGYSNSAMNPIIYTVFNRDYQIALKKLFTKGGGRGQSSGSRTRKTRL